MTTAYDLFDHIRENLTSSLSSNTIYALRDYFFGYVAALEHLSQPLAPGSPPFTQFANWMARRFGKSTISLHGNWTRTKKGWWRLLIEEYISEEEAFKKFFQLLDEFRNRQKIILATCDCRMVMKANLIMDQCTGDIPDNLRAIRYLPDEEICLSIVYSGTREEEPACFESIDTLFEHVQKHFGVQRELWSLLNQSNQSGQSR
jgi:hypothetical protein